MTTIDSGRDRDKPRGAEAALTRCTWQPHYLPPATETACRPVRTHEPEWVSGTPGPATTRITAPLQAAHGRVQGSIPLSFPKPDLDKRPGRGMITRLFREAAKSAASRDDDKPKSRQRRKRGETEGQFRLLMRRIMRRSDVRPQFGNAAAKAGRRSSTRSAPLETCITAAFVASPWCNPLNGIEFYGSNLAGFSDFGTETDMGIDHISLEP